jgi:hypothetical protein
MRQAVSTTPHGAPPRCPTHRIRVRLSLATIEELDHLAEVHHLTRQDVLRQILTAGLLSDTPLQAAGPAPIERLQAHGQLTYARSLELAAVRAGA